MDIQDAERALYRRAYSAAVDDRVRQMHIRSVDTKIDEAYDEMSAWRDLREWLTAQEHKDREMKKVYAKVSGA